jgi:hypothetical protein
MQSDRNISEEDSNDVGADAPKIGGSSLFVDCPKCGARLTLLRSRLPPIDSCGFESYILECENCATVLVGVVDPLDEALLVTPAESECS